MHMHMCAYVCVRGRIRYARQCAYAYDAYAYAYDAYAYDAYAYAFDAYAYDASCE